MTSTTPTSDRILDLTAELVAQSVRFPKELHDRLRRLADEQDRSFSAQIVWACRRYFEELDKPDRTELETPGPGEAPAFHLLETWQGERVPPGAPFECPPGPHTHDIPPSDGFVVEVEGRIVPLLTVEALEDGSYWMSLDHRFGVAAHTYEELWRWGWFLAHAIAIGEGRASHAYPGRIRQLVDEGWAIMDESGCGDQTVEVTLTFSIPAMANSDQWAYEVRDMLSRTAYDAGARDVCTRLIGLAPLEIDRRGLEPAELKEITDLDPRPKPVSQVLTIPSMTTDDGLEETTTIEIGVPLVERDDEGTPPTA